jgi:leucyl/phenylalanyl-tRNA--protein transferase
MPASRYPDWAAFEFPAGPAGPSSPAGPAPAADIPVAFCADLSPDSVLGAYRRGIVPLPAGDEYFRTLNEVRYGDLVADGTIAVVGDPGDDPYWTAWWSPDPRPVIGAGVHLGRQVRKRLRQDGLVTTADSEFLAVAEACREGRPTRWLTDPLLATLAKLHTEGWAHSIEVWRDGELVGGAMGIGFGTVFSGDSLFGRHPGAAAVAVADLRDRLIPDGPVLADPVIDAQWDSPFLRSLGAVPVARAGFLARLACPPEPLPLPLPLPLRTEPLPARRLLGLPRFSATAVLAPRTTARRWIVLYSEGWETIHCHAQPVHGTAIRQTVLGSVVPVTVLGSVVRVTVLGSVVRVTVLGSVVRVTVMRWAGRGGRPDRVTSGREAALRAGRGRRSAPGARPRTGRAGTAGSRRRRP